MNAFFEKSAEKANNRLHFSKIYDTMVLIKELPISTGLILYSNGGIAYGEFNEKPAACI